MTIRVPPLLGVDAYLGPVPGAPSRPPHGGLRETHLALIRFQGQVRRAYVKHFSVTEPFGLFNEALACTLLSGLGVPCSEGAVLPAPVLGSDEATLAFASLEAARGFEGTAKQIYQPLGPEQLDEVTRRLHACAAFASIIAADQLLGNSDRNIGNLAFTGPRSIEIFDHEAILGGAAFPTERLYEPQVWARSKLIEDLAPIQALSPRLKTGIIAAAEVLVDLSLSGILCLRHDM